MWSQLDLSQPNLIITRLRVNLFDVLPNPAWPTHVATYFGTCLYRECYWHILRQNAEWDPWGVPDDYECEVVENDAPVPKHVPLHRPGPLPEEFYKTLGAVMNGKSDAAPKKEEPAIPSGSQWVCALLVYVVGLGLFLRAGLVSIKRKLNPYYFMHCCSWYVQITMLWGQKVYVTDTWFRSSINTNSADFTWAHCISLSSFFL